MKSVLEMAIDAYPEDKKTFEWLGPICLKSVAKLNLETLSETLGCEIGLNVALLQKIANGWNSETTSEIRSVAHALLDVAEKIDVLEQGSYRLAKFAAQEEEKND